MIHFHRRRVHRILGYGLSMQINNAVTTDKTNHTIYNLQEKAWKVSDESCELVYGWRMVRNKQPTKGGL